MISIKKLFAQILFTNNAQPTVQCTIELSNNIVVKSAIPARNEQSLTTTEMAQFINDVIAPACINQEMNVLKLDAMLMDLQSEHQNNLGINTTLVVSMALFQAQAKVLNIELYQLIQSVSGTPTIKIPQIIFSLLALKNDETPQAVVEVLALTKNNVYQKALESAIQLNNTLEKILQIDGINHTLSKFGSYQLNNLSLQHALECTQKAQAAMAENVYHIGLSLDGSHIFDQKTDSYIIDKQIIHASKISEYYQTLLTQHEELHYVQDPVNSSDTIAWQTITANHKTIAIAADDMLNTNPLKIRFAIKKQLCSVVIIKPEQLPTISQALAAINACQHHKMNFCISADNVGINDTFVADIAVGTCADYFKAGAPQGAEHISKYNRLLEIEAMMN